MIKTAVMGYGTIGSGVAEILDKNRDVIAGQAGHQEQGCHSRPGRTGSGVKVCPGFKGVPGQSGGR